MNNHTLQSHLKSPPRSIRVFPELRQAHVEELTGTSLRTTYFLHRKYDLLDARLPEEYIPTTLLQLCWNLHRSSASILELPEPLWLRFLPAWVLLALIWKLRPTDGTPSEIVFFAIENSPPNQLFGGSTWRRLLFRHTMGRLIGRLVSRCAFGSPQSEACYRALVDFRYMSTRLFLDLLSPRDPKPKQRKSVAFVGTLETRKGADLLLRAWPEVEAATPGAHLSVFGDGPLRQQFVKWAESKPHSRHFAGTLPRYDILCSLDACQVLVAPSVPCGRWREQIGRPIQEALACGATIVTSTESGLAEYLCAAGHQVLSIQELRTGLAKAIVTAIDHPVSPQRVRASLPATTGRTKADVWLHT